MDKYLKEHYLFKEEYNTLDVDYASVSYDNFLSTYLLPMKTNIEDGGTYRAFSVNAVKRYIYSYIMETGSSRTRANTRATSVVGYTLPSLSGGVHIIICSTPATFAGRTFIRTDEG